MRTLSSRLQSDGPLNDDELHSWVRINMGVDIPRVAVCDDHDPPFKVLADCYFERVSSVLVLANRGGAKTFIVAILHFANATYKPGCQGLQFGATEAQGNRCYEKIEDWCYVHDKSTGRRTDEIRDFIQEKPKKSETIWKTQSKVEVVAGSEKAVSGPHPQKAGADEADQMEDPVWNQSRGMAVAANATGPLPPFMAHLKGVIPPQDIVTSTRNSTKGRMQALIDEVNEDVKAGNIPEFDLYTWCIWETVAEVPNCRGADAEKREARLKELGRDPKELCPCNRVVKGKVKDLETGEFVPRTLEVVCAGKAFRARGWKPYIDLRQTFKRNTPGTWMLQHECRKGQDENAYIKDWSLDEYGIHGYEPRPEYGPIYQGVDWGSGNPAAVLWFQKLKVDVPAFDFMWEPIYLEAGIYVLFKEVYVAGIDSTRLARRVIAIENDFKNQYGVTWGPKGRFCDPQGLGDRLRWFNMGLKSTWPGKTRRKDRMIETVQNLVIDDLFAVVVDECPNFCEEVEIWQKKPGTDIELDKNNHAMAAWRYGIYNAEAVEGPGGSNQDDDLEREAQEQSPSSTQAMRGTKKAGPLALDDVRTELNEFDVVTMR
jgi:hypothetical protein